MTNKKPQLERFKKIARDLDCDEDEERFDAALKKIALESGKKKPKSNEQKPKEK